MRKVAQGSQLFRLALAGQNRAHHPQSRSAGELADDGSPVLLPPLVPGAAASVMDLDIERLERLLHVQHVRAGHLDVIIAQPLIAAQPTHLLGGHKARTQEPVGVQLGQPLAVAHLALAPRQIARVRAVDHADLEAGGLEHFVKRERCKRPWPPWPRS